MSYPRRYEKPKKFPALISRVAEIVDAPSNGEGWSIRHRVGDYVLAHYDVRKNYRPDMKKIGHVRGLIVDMEKSEIVRQTFAYEIECEHDSLLVNGDGSLTLVELESGEEHVLPKDDWKLARPYEGVIIDVWKDKNGTVRLSSLMHIDIISGISHQNNDIPYSTMWKQLGLPKPEILFSEKYKTSSYVHTFLLSHPGLLMATKEMLGTGYAVYLGYKKMNRNDPDTEPEAVDICKVVPNTTSFLIQAQQAKPGEKLIYLPSEISIEDANIHLRYGHFDKWDDKDVDPKIRTGEFVIVTNKKTGQMYRVLSPAYRWRMLIRGDHKYILHNFHILAGFVNISTKLSREQRERRKQGYKVFSRPNHFKDGFFPHLTHESEEQIKSVVNSGGAVVRLIGTQKLDVDRSAKDRLENIWLCLLLAVPIHRQLEVLTCKEKYESNLLKGASAALMISVGDAKGTKPLGTPRNDKEAKKHHELIENAKRLAFSHPPSYVTSAVARQEWRLAMMVTKLKRMKPERSYTLIKEFIKGIENSRKRQNSD